MNASKEKIILAAEACTCVCFYLKMSEVKFICDKAKRLELLINDIPYKYTYSMIKY